MIKKADFKSSSSGLNIALSGKSKKSSRKSSKGKSSSSKNKKSDLKKKTATKNKSKSKSGTGNVVKHRVSLDPLREMLSVLVNKANTRANEIIERGLSSRALIEADRTLHKQSSRANDSELFNANLKTRRQINREFARVNTFLNDYTSTVEGAENFETDLRNLAGAFGGKWANVEGNEGKYYDVTRIKDDLAEKAFDMYRKVVEAAGGWERAVGMFQGKESLIGYGSENLINAIYDMIENNVEDELIMNRAQNMIETGLRTYEEMSKKQVSDYDYGIVFDDEDAQRRRTFYTWRRNYRKENGLDG